MFWKRFDKCKPKKNGWYQCTIVYPFHDSYQSYVMDLYYYTEIGKWKDNRRQSVFDTYEVFGYEESNEKHQLSTIDLCDRTDQVIAWKKLPKVYRRIKDVTNVSIQ